MHKDQFTATGPAFGGSGFPQAGFSNNDQSNQDPQDFEYGVNVQGKQCGVYGQSVKNNEGRDSLVVGVGVEGVGETFGVVGSGGRGLAGVLGVHNRSGIGVAGTVMRGGTGVVGASFAALNSPHSNLLELPNSADGSGTGVLGASGSGTGVRGTSDSGDGVTGGTSGDNKSGVFGFNKGAGPGMVGVSVNGDGVVGLTGGLGRSAVLGENTGGPGGYLEVLGVTGRANAAGGIGVSGESANGVGVSGLGGVYGARLQGGRAPLRLAPAATTGAPQSGFHLIGEFFVDRQGSLFFCSRSGNPGKWNRVQMVAV